MARTPSPVALDLEHLAAAMRLDGQTITGLAAATGYSKQYVNDLTKGRRTGNPAVIKAFADALKVPVSMLTRIPERAA